MTITITAGWCTPSPRHNSATGYGSKIPTRFMVECSDNRSRRVYAICYSNAASLYIIVGGKRRPLLTDEEIMLADVATNSTGENHNA